MIEIDAINKRINEMSEDLIMSRQNSISMQTQDSCKEHDWDYGEDRNPSPKYVLLAEEFENCARHHGIKVGWSRNIPPMKPLFDDLYQDFDESQSSFCCNRIILFFIAIFYLSYFGWYIYGEYRKQEERYAWLSTWVNMLAP